MGIGPVALVGYTSAGKTTLFNSLTGKEKEMNKGLFTTLDTVVGKLKSPKLDQPILISDTIGFITNLPPVLIESFKTTLLESLEAKLLLHVVDAADPMVMQKISVVDEILDQLQAKQPRMLVLNKTDLISTKDLVLLEQEIARYWRANKQLRQFYQLIKVSAVTGENFNILKEQISNFFE